jgi:hypothetical protein
MEPDDMAQLRQKAGAFGQPNFQKIPGGLFRDGRPCGSHCYAMS